MAELSKEVKMILLLNAIPALVYAFLFLGIPDIYVQITDAMFYNPITLRQLGGSILILGIGNVVAIKRNDMDKLKLFWEMGILWLIIMVILGIWSAFAFPGSLAAQTGTWIANVILILLTVLNLYIYNKEVK